MEKIIILALLANLLVTGQSYAQTEDPAPQQETGLKERVEKLEEEIKVLKKNQDSLIAIQENSCVRNSKAAEVFRNLCKRMEKATNKSRGASAAFKTDMAFLDMTPVKDFLAEQSVLPGSAFYGFDFEIPNRFEIFALFGGELFFGKGDGFRIGGFGRGGERGYTTTRADTTWEIGVGIGFGGIMIEKAFVFNKGTLRIGGYAGLGEMSIEGPEKDEDEDEGEEEGEETEEEGGEASIVAGDIQLGYSITIKKWLHIGFDAGVFIFRSYHEREDEDSNDTDLHIGSFTTVNPKIGIKILIGNLG